MAMATTGIRERVACGALTGALADGVVLARGMATVIEASGAGAPVTVGAVGGFRVSMISVSLDVSGAEAGEGTTLCAATGTVLTSPTVWRTTSRSRRTSAQLAYRSSARFARQRRMISTTRESTAGHSDSSGGGS